MKKLQGVSKAKGTKAARGASTRAAKGNVAGNAGRAALAAAMLGFPGILVPRLGVAQSAAASPASPSKEPGAKVAMNFAKVEPGYRALKMSGTYTVLGVGDGHVIFKAADGSMFYLDPTTGDKRSVAVDYFLKVEAIKSERSAMGGRNGGRAGGVLKVKFPDLIVISFSGLDAKGNPVLRNARNETFTFDPRTGDKILLPSAK